MSLTWFETTSELLTNGEAQPGLVVHPLYAGPFPYVKDANAARADVELVAAKIFKVTIELDAYAVVALCRLSDTDVPYWSLYCGDGQVQGTYRQDGKTLAAQLKAEGKVSSAVLSKLETADWVNKVPDMGACGFFKMYARSKRYCTHTKAVLAQLTDADLVEMATNLREWKAGAGTVDPDSPCTLSPEEVAFYDAAFIQHVLLAGERGAGKTYLARQAAAKFEAVYLEMQMHPSMEAWEFRAHDRAWNGKVFTVLGKLAEAVHWIQQGKRVVLCMDEFLNMNPVYQTVINTALTLTSNETYIIETGRIIDQGDGVGTLETVEVPSDMLWIVATSNIGARYGLDKIAPSVRARFQIVLMNTNAARTQTILEKTLAKYDMPTDVAVMFKNFIESCNQAVLENTLDEEATTRLACNVLRACYMKAQREKKKVNTLKSLLPMIKLQLMREIAQVVNFELGPLDEDQEARYAALVDACFRIK